jgi:hypothetical protein
LLRRDPAAGFTWSLNWPWSKRKACLFKSGKILNRFSEADSQRFAGPPAYTAVAVYKHAETGRTWWLFNGEFWVENEGYSQEHMTLLLLAKQYEKQQKLERAAARVRRGSSPSPVRRQPIPDDVKQFVWQRDGGRCVICGKQELLEYDHIIPVAKGGGNTARNLQLLCEACNRSKGANLV